MSPLLSEPLTLQKSSSNPDFRKRAEYCFESTVSEERTHWVLRQTWWVLRKAWWVRFGTETIGWEELTEFAPRNSVSPEKLTEFGAWNRTPRNRIRSVSEVSLAATGTKPEQASRTVGTVLSGTETGSVRTAFQELKPETKLCLSNLYSEPPKRGPENWCRAKIVEKGSKHIIWHFLTIFALREKHRKVSKHFWHFLTFFDVAPFRWPLLRSADVQETWRNLFLQNRPNRNWKLLEPSCARTATEPNRTGATLPSWETLWPIARQV